MSEDNLFFDRFEDIERTYGHLPHWTQGHKLYFVTFRLADSLPLEVLKRYEQECLYMEQVIRGHGGLPEDWKRYEVEKHNKVLRYLDNGYGECPLKRPKVRQIVMDAFAHIDGKSCIVHAYVIMPNHVHLLIEIFEGESITKVVGGVKQFTAHHINALLGKKGKLWQREVHDRIIRNEAHYNHSLRYILHNPSHCDPGTFTLYLAKLGGDASQRRTLGGEPS